MRVVVDALGGAGDADEVHQFDGAGGRRAAREAEIAVIRLGKMVWMSAPVEASQQAGARLEAAAQADRLVGVANGYLGYLEAADVVAQAGGESRKQYYGAGMLDALEEAAKIAGDAVR